MSGVDQMRSPREPQQGEASAYFRARLVCARSSANSCAALVGLRDEPAPVVARAATLLSASTGPVRRAPSSGLQCDDPALAIQLRGLSGPALEGAVEGRAFGKAELFCRLLNAH